jgi:hypothetical protein
MNQKIILTWLDRRNQRIVEECYLVSEDTDVFSFDGEPVFGVMEMMAKLDFVVFEDNEGLFCLHPKKIVNIEIVKEK